MYKYVSELRKLVGTRPLILCGANVILLDDRNRLLLHHRRDNDTWGLPGGFMELGESLEETAARELREEVGLTCRDLRLFGVYSGPDLYYRYPNGNEVHNVTVTYLCRDFSGTISVDQAEGKEAAFFTLDEIPAQISPPIRVIIGDFRRRYQDIPTGDRPETP
jgi:ADP-ribose pyrophosphatase YjhB (NUDIX family)